jgi:hypothetical protein
MPPPWPSPWLLGSGSPADTHDLLLVGLSGSGKSNVLLQLLLHLWGAFFNITILSPNLNPAEPREDWDILKRLPRSRKIFWDYRLNEGTIGRAFSQPDPDGQKWDLIIIDDFSRVLGEEGGKKMAKFIAGQLDNMRGRRLVSRKLCEVTV